jgi:hypothetical protein
MKNVKNIKDRMKAVHDRQKNYIDFHTQHHDDFKKYNEKNIFLASCF